MPSAIIKLKKIPRNRGMTYVELIVVLSIFALMTSIVVFNYGEFQAKVDIKNLASDIALKFVEAQNDSLSGALPPLAQQILIPSPSSWKPSYGVYINTVEDNASFAYFTDLDQNGELSNPDCAGVGECLEKITLTKGNTISSIEVFYAGNESLTQPTISDLTVTFRRPKSEARMITAGGFSSQVSYIQITLKSPPGKSSSSLIKVFPSGRIQVD